MRVALIDTNLLLLLVVGTHSVELISRHKRVRDFDSSDFFILSKLVSTYQSITTTPCVLTEVSNLLGNTDQHVLLTPAMIQICDPLNELHTPKSRLFQWQGYDRLGYTDVSLLAATETSAGDSQLITVDLLLYQEALYQGLSAINFNHLRVN